MCTRQRPAWDIRVNSRSRSGALPQKITLKAALILYRPAETKSGREKLLRGPAQQRHLAGVPCIFLTILQASHTGFGSPAAACTFKQEDMCYLAAPAAAQLMGCW